MTMAGFYSEVHVMGQENVPRDGPIVLAATHHNEIIDIAALSVTIPFRRQISYWAKSTLFANPLAGALLRSSGSIPVCRNPDSEQNGSRSDATASRAALFEHTVAALARDGAVGVFPGGTSYTKPAIVRVKHGAAWAAVEYARAVASRTVSGAERAVVIVPAAVVYKDKSRYQSRVLVRYDKPIGVHDFLTELDWADEKGVHAAVKEITEKIYQRLKKMTINAPDWDTFNSAKMAAEIMCGNETSMSEHVRVTQGLVQILSDESEETQRLKESLVAYVGLLHYAGISHRALDHLYPTLVIVSSSSAAVSIAILTVLRQLCATFLHPSMIAFIPMFIVHVPMYVIGWFAARFLAKRDEEESKAQYKAIFGGLGMALLYGMVVHKSLKALTHEAMSTMFIRDASRLSGTVIFSLCTISVLWTWHNSLVQGNLERWRRLAASVKFLAGVISPTSIDVLGDRLAAYARPPRPAENRIIGRHVSADARTSTASPPPVSSRILIRPLLAARADALEAVRKLEGVARVEGSQGLQRQDLPKGD